MATALPKAVAIGSSRPIMPHTATYSMRAARAPQYMQPVRDTRALQYGEFAGPGGSSFGQEKVSREAEVIATPEGDGPVHDAWRNHLPAFGAQDMDKILADYTERSTVTVYNFEDGSISVFKGLDEIKNCFTGLFENMFQTTDLRAPLQVVKEASDSVPGSVFVVWSAAVSGYLEATDTFIFDSNGKILEQNVAVTYRKKRMFGSPDEVEPAVVAPEGSGPVHDAWQNHFSAFGAQDVDKILKDYTESSVITVYNQADGSQNVYEGLDGVKKCFTGLFENLYDTSDLKAPIQIVQEGGDGGQAEVFLIWSAKASGYTTATDTFIFDNAGKILQQHVVVRYKDPRKMRARFIRPAR
eukprot:gnl/MRDRNA2_/MRDRNA2_186503_c0_seq1.p1 gnl/MRDRNA2_/MRDRNA2_186503_c0~~gnl/MRDRNA2_/MRDRNA2_186503_c0_seq1.p1  ORF type:complete len:374 (+),score=70.08 gnl/MRDRNA2_/MRDRNA2_186503_c0_seq1:58-1122(+)